MIKTKFFSKPFAGVNAALLAHRKHESKLLEKIEETKDNDIVHRAYCRLYAKLMESKAELAELL